MKLRRLFTSNLKTLRKGKGLTQEALAEKLDISVRYVQLMEGKSTPNIKLDTLEKLAKVLKIKPNKLLE